MSKRDRLVIVGSALLIAGTLLFGRLPAVFAVFTPPAACTAVSGAVISATSWNTCIAAIAAAVNSIDNSKVSASAGIVGSKLDLTSGTGRITSAAGTLTVDGQAGFSITQTWNNAAGTFDGALIDITDTTSAAASKGLRVRVNGVDVATVDKTGKATFNAAVFGAGITSTSGGVTFPDATIQTTAATTTVIPANTVAFFNLVSCPTGWTEYTALRGRIPVGLPSGGTLAGDNVPADYSDKEDRTHTHTMAGGSSPLMTGGDYNVAPANSAGVPTHQLLACSKS